MHNEFIDWFFNDFTDVVLGMIASALSLIIKIITFPIWVIPFIYWYFAIWKEGQVK